MFIFAFVEPLPDEFESPLRARIKVWRLGTNVFLGRVTWYVSAGSRYFVISFSRALSNCIATTFLSQFQVVKMVTVSHLDLILLEIPATSNLTLARILEEYHVYSTCCFIANAYRSLTLRYLVTYRGVWSLQQLCQCLFRGPRTG
jgi:hypothetical protein